MGRFPAVSYGAQRLPFCSADGGVASFVGGFFCGVETMFLSRLDTADTINVAVVLSPDDVQTLRNDRSLGFSLYDAGLIGHRQTRVLVAYVKPATLATMRYGYWPIFADARYILLLTDESFRHLDAGEPVAMPMGSESPVDRFVLTVGDKLPDDANRAFARLGMVPANDLAPFSQRIPTGALPTVSVAVPTV